MTCRVARLYHNPTQLKDLFSCCKCGPTYLKVFRSSKSFGPYLCRSCAQAIVECRVAKELVPEPVRCLVPS
jgi:hypothetical protein